MSIQPLISCLEIKDPVLDILPVKDLASLVYKIAGDLNNTSCLNQTLISKCWQKLMTENQLMKGFAGKLLMKNRKIEKTLIPSEKFKQLMEKLKDLDPPLSDLISQHDPLDLLLYERITQYLQDYSLEEAWIDIRWALLQHGAINLPNCEFYHAGATIAPDQRAAAKIRQWFDNVDAHNAAVIANIQILCINNVDLFVIPEIIGRFTGLIDLSIHDCPLVLLPKKEFFQKLRNLEQLSILKTEISMIPEDTFESTSLRC